MPAPEIREENRVLGEATPKKGKRRSAVMAKQSAQKDLLDILGGDNDDDKDTTGGIVLGESAKNAELLKDLFGSGLTTNDPPASQRRSNVSDIMDLFGSGPVGGLTATSPPPAIVVGGSTSTLGDLFGRTAEQSPPQSQTYRASPLIQN